MNITPPLEYSSAVMSTALGVLEAQANALRYLTDVYNQDESLRMQFFRSLELMHNSLMNRGKIIFTGMGKSYKICHKISATMASLGIHSTVLHPGEALHGDMGMIQPIDVIVAISASGESPELEQLFQHTPQVEVVLLTCQHNKETTLSRRSAAVVAAHVPENMSEEQTYGLKAPTVSTTCCLAVGDALSITLAEMLEPDLDARRTAFLKSHPGGAIGMHSKSHNV